MNMFYEIGPRVRARRNTEHFSQQEIYICLIEPGESPLRLRVFFTWVFAAMNNFVIKTVFFLLLEGPSSAFLSSCFISIHGPSNSFE